LVAGGFITLTPSSDGITISSTGSAILSGNYVSATTFNTFTGTTAPATYALKTNFNSFSGTTAPATYLSKSAFNTYSGNTVIRQNLAYATGITLNLSGLEEKRFVITGATTGNITFSFSNTTNVEFFSVDLSGSTTVAITNPSTVRMQQYEVDNSRWVSATKVLTLAAGNYQLVYSYNPSNALYKLNCSDKYV
jgi:hypothetical protein